MKVVDDIKAGVVNMINTMIDTMMEPIKDIFLFWSSLVYSFTQKITRFNNRVLYSVFTEIEKDLVPNPIPKGSALVYIPYEWRTLLVSQTHVQMSKAARWLNEKLAKVAMSKPTSVWKSSIILGLGLTIRQTCTQGLIVRQTCSQGCCKS